MRIVHVNTSRPYDVCIGSGLLNCAGEELRKVMSPCRLALVTDTTVDALYGDAAETSLRDGGFDVVRFAFEAGEKHKTLETLGEILEFMAENQLTRTDAVAALGGGVVGDMAGFAAAVYMRGIRFVQMPTTLLAAVDSSVGGKTAVDLKAGKNLAGCFHQPSLVLTDTDVLRKLPPHLLSDGAAEMIKHGVLKDPQLFEMLCRPDWTDDLDALIERNVCIKRDVVNADEFEAGTRQLLNLGHTFGHAAEACSEYRMGHGASVAVGMVIAAGAARRPDLCRAIIRANRNCGLPVTVDFSAEALARAALSDKKRRGDCITLVLPEAIGRCKLEKIPVSALEDTFRRGLKMAEEWS